MTDLFSKLLKKLNRSKISTMSLETSSYNTTLTNNLVITTRFKIPDPDYITTFTVIPGRGKFGIGSADGIENIGYHQYNNVGTMIKDIDLVIGNGYKDTVESWPASNISSTYFASNIVTDHNVKKDSDIYAYNVDNPEHYTIYTATGMFDYKEDHGLFNDIILAYTNQSEITIGIVWEVDTNEDIDLSTYISQLTPITTSTVITPDSEIVEYDMEGGTLISYDNIMGIFAQMGLILKISNPSTFSELQIQNLTLTATYGVYGFYDSKLNPIIMEQFNINTEDSKIIIPFIDIDYDEIIILITLDNGLANIDFSKGDIIITLIK